MFGHAFNGSIEKTALVKVGGVDVGQVRVDTACTDDFDAIILATRGNLSSIPALHGFYEHPNACFPENPGDVHGLLNGVVYDGREFVYHRYDKVTSTIIFRPLVPAATVTAGVETVGEKHTADTWPIGGDRGETAAQESDDANLHASVQGSLDSLPPVYDQHPLTPADATGLSLNDVAVASTGTGLVGV